MGSAVLPLQESLANYDATRYWKSRDHHASSRSVSTSAELRCTPALANILIFGLHLQHWIWSYQTGYVLHPSIQSSRHGLRVADVGTGNAYVSIPSVSEAVSRHRLSLYAQSSDVRGGTACLKLHTPRLFWKCGLFDGLVHGYSTSPNTFIPLPHCQGSISPRLAFRLSNGCLRI
jgi:hypothetical protein